MLSETAALKILDQEDDFRLADGVFCAASDLTNNEVDFDSEDEPLKTISMVWLASGVIDNGGFGYLLEYKCGNDREMRLIADAFERVGATKCAEAFRRLFAVFPDGRIIDDHDTKDAYYTALNESKRLEIDRLFWSESRNIDRVVAAFIRQNRQAVLRELTGHQDGRTKP
ncbi:MAG: DUF4375 domain-containing protein [Planctomycetota bacterium]